MRHNNNNSLIFLGIILIIFLLAFLLPAIMLTQTDTNEVSIRQTVDEATVIDNNLESIITQGQGNNEFNITLYNTKTGASNNTTAISPSQNKTIQLDSQNITIYNEAHVTSDKYLVTYVYPNYYNWPEGTQIIVENLVLILLAIMLILIFVAIVYGLGG